MIKIRRKIPHFSVTGVTSNDINNTFNEITEKSYPGKWLVVFSGLKTSLSFVLPKLLNSGDSMMNLQTAMQQILGASTDSEFVHLAWRREKEGVAERATFIVALIISCDL